MNANYLMFQAPLFNQLEYNKKIDKKSLNPLIFFKTQVRGLLQITG